MIGFAGGYGPFRTYVVEPILPVRGLFVAPAASFSAFRRALAPTSQLRHFASLLVNSSNGRVKRQFRWLEISAGRRDIRVVEELLHCVEVRLADERGTERGVSAPIPSTRSSHSGAETDVRSASALTNNMKSTVYLETTMSAT